MSKAVEKMMKCCCGCDPCICAYLWHIGHEPIRTEEEKRKDELRILGYAQ